MPVVKYTIVAMEMYRMMAGLQLPTLVTTGGSVEGMGRCVPTRRVAFTEACVSVMQLSRNV